MRKGKAIKVDDCHVNAAGVLGGGKCKGAAPLKYENHQWQRRREAYPPVADQIRRKNSSDYRPG